LNSFKNIARKEFLKSALFDLITIIAVFLVINVAGLVADRVSITAFPQLVDIVALKESGNEQAFEEAVVEFGPTITRVMWILLAIIVVSFILLVFFISLFYGNAWLSGLKKKFNNLFFRKYFIMNLIWFLFWIIITLLIIFLLSPQMALVFLFIETILFLYLDPAMRAVFDENKSLWSNLRKFFKISRKFHWFMPFMLLSLIFIIIIVLTMALLLNIEWLMVVCFVILILLLIGWMRNYIIALVNEMRN